MLVASWVELGDRDGAYPGLGGVLMPDGMSPRPGDNHEKGQG